MKDIISPGPAGPQKPKTKPRADIQSWNCIPKETDEDLTTI